jgi:hypothetical protein
MKNIKHIFTALLILLVYFLIASYIKPDNLVFIVLVFLIAGFFIFNLMIRKSLSFEKYFTSKYNLLTSKFNRKKSFEISKGLMYEKVIEVINNSDFRIVDTDKEKFKLLAVSSVSFKSWGKNERNYENLLNEIENSLII